MRVAVTYHMKTAGLGRVGDIVELPDAQPWPADFTPAFVLWPEALQKAAQTDDPEDWLAALNAVESLARRLMARCVASEGRGAASMAAAIEQMNGRIMEAHLRLGFLWRRRCVD